MIGFGRAVGETMIVLMATGNTPVLDWSPLNGMRTLSANIAVEMPEAPARRHALPRAVPVRLRAVPDDVLRQHHRRAGPPAPAREVQGDLTMELAQGLRARRPPGLAHRQRARDVPGDDPGHAARDPDERPRVSSGRRRSSSSKLKDGSLLAGELTQRQAIPDPGPARSRAEAPRAAQGRQPRSLRHRLQVGGRGPDRRAHAAARALPRRAQRVRAAASARPCGCWRATSRRRPGRPRRALLPGAGRAGGARPAGDERRSRRTRSARSTTRSSGSGSSAASSTTVRSRTPRATSHAERQALDERETKHKAAYAELEEKLAKQMESRRPGRGSCSRPSTARRRSCARSTSTAPIPPTTWAGSAAPRSTRAGSGPS